MIQLLAEIAEHVTWPDVAMGAVIATGVCVYFWILSKS